MKQQNAIIYRVNHIILYKSKTVLLFHLGLQVTTDIYFPWASRVLNMGFYTISHSHTYLL